MKLVRRIFKWSAVVLFVMILIPFLALLGAWGTYRYVVASKPGALPLPVATRTLGSHVDPFIATGGVAWVCGHDTPAATTPFGMVRLAPDTASLFTSEQCFNRSGYFYGDNKIIGFSHTRLVGADAREGGVFRVFPSTTAPERVDRDELRFVRFSHAQESAAPGYYAVHLPKDDIRAELTATTRTGFHRYTFAPNTTPHLSLDVSSVLGGGRSENATARVLPDAWQVEGSARIFGSFSGRYDGLDVYFVAECSEPFTAFGTWNDATYKAGETLANGKRIAIDLAFSEEQQPRPIELRIGLSYVSIDNARANLAAEAKDKSFEAVVTQARDAWESQLARIQIDGGTDRQRRIFYSALYRTFLMPTTFNDANGDYVGFDRAVHTADGFTYYTDFSLWDSFRTVHPLYNLFARVEQRDMMQSLLEMAKAGGAFPRWPSGCGYTNCMFGTPADVAVSEAYLKGVRDFDIELAYSKMRETALTGPPAGSRFSGREDLDDYLQYGYCPSDLMSEAVARNLEYAWCDNSLSLLATELGKTDDATLFARHAQSYRQLWDPRRLFFVPKDSKGVFMPNFDPMKLSFTDSGRKFTEDYVEGSPMQWRWGVPFDMEGFVSLWPFKEQFVKELETYLEKSNSNVGHWYPGSNYWHGNEPFIHAAYLFNAAGRPDLTQKWVRHLLETKYSDDYVGLDGNDDGGTLSAWYVFSALGFYPIAGTTRYELGAPLFPKAVINMGDGKTLTVIADNYAPERVYVESVTLNGAPLETTHFTHDAIANGGELRFKMTNTPKP